MSELERINKIKLKRILIDYPFYGYFLIQLQFKLKEDILTASTDGKYVYFNPNWTKTLTDRQLITVILHEIKHIVFCHLYRTNGRDMSTWNKATDYVINYQLIYEENQKQIEGMYLDNKYINKSAEEIYNILRKEKQNADNRRCNGKSERSGKSSDENIGNSRNNRQGKGNEKIGEGVEQTNKENEEKGKSSGIGDFERPRGNSTDEIEKIKEEITKAVRYAEKAGKMPANMKREVDKLLKPQIRWEDLLANWMNEKSQDDFSWLKRDETIKDWYFPSLEDESIGKLAIVLDVSGSISMNLYNRFISELNGLKQKYSFEAIVISFDSRIQNVKRFSRQQPIKFSTNGGGGTMIKPVFDLLKKEQNLTGCIIFTDLYINDLYGVKQPRYDVLWMCYSNVKTAKFGKVINIKL